MLVEFISILNFVMFKSAQLYCLNTALDLINTLSKVYVHGSFWLVVPSVPPSPTTAFVALWPTVYLHALFCRIFHVRCGASQTNSRFLHFQFEVLMTFFILGIGYIFCNFGTSILRLLTFQVNLADSSASKEARIQEVEAKFTHCQAMCNRITQVWS